MAHPAPVPLSVPAVGGSAQAVAGVGSSGAISIALAGLLLLAMFPHALRRLRIAASPSLTAPFLLIPQRPG